MKCTWKKTPKQINIVDFTESTGPTISLPANPLQIFMCFFTEELIKMIVDQSNLFAESCMGEEKYILCTIITSEEIKAYFGFIILMGLVPHPSVYDYWSTDPIFHYAPIADHISRDRFLEIHKYLHFVDNSTIPVYGSDEYDKLFKIRPIVDYLRERFIDIYKPNRDVSIDEAMIKFKGRSSMKQYMPMKPIKRGFKVWMRADAKNGFVSEMDIYVGKKGKKVETGLGRRVVESLTEKLSGKLYHIYFDNFFCSIPLFTLIVQ